MMVELLANKGGAVNGRVYDSTPFLFNEDHPADAHFGEVLKEAGLNYYGVERMYSGTSGEEARIFILSKCTECKLFSSRQKFSSGRFIIKDFVTWSRISSRLVRRAARMTR